MIFVDNISAIKLVKNPEFHKRTKHMDVRYHFIRERIESGELKVEYLCTENQKADIFTKALPRERFCMLRESVGIIERMTRRNGGSVGNVSCVSPAFRRKARDLIGHSRRSERESV